MRLEGRRKIGLDMDGTLAKSHEAIVAEYNAENHTNYTIEDIDSYSNWRIPMAFPEFAARHLDIWMNKWNTVLPSISPATLGQLVEAHEVDVVTYQWRPGYAECMQLWFKEFFPKIDIKIRITSSADEKAHLGYDVLLDDAPPLAEELIKNKSLNTVLVMVEQPWNRKENYEEHGHKIIRVKTLDQGIGLLVNGAMLRNGNSTKQQPRSKLR